MCVGSCFFQTKPWYSSNQRSSKLDDPKWSQVCTASWWKFSLWRFHGELWDVVEKDVVGTPPLSRWKFSLWIFGKVGVFRKNGGSFALKFWADVRKMRWFTDVVRVMRWFTVKPLDFGAQYFRTNLSVEYCSYCYFRQIVYCSSWNLFLMQWNKMRPRNYKSESCQPTVGTFGNMFGPLDFCGRFLKPASTISMMIHMFFQESKIIPTRSNQPWNGH